MIGNGQSDIALEIEAFIRSNYLVADSKHLHREESLIQSGIIDSTGILELITFLEGRFTLRFEDDELTAEHFGSIDQIVRFLHAKLDEKRSQL